MPSHACAGSVIYSKCLRQQQQLTNNKITGRDFSHRCSRSSIFTRWPTGSKGIWKHPAVSIDCTTEKHSTVSHCITAKEWAALIITDHMLINTQLNLCAWVGHLLWNRTRLTWRSNSHVRRLTQNLVDLDTTTTPDVSCNVLNVSFATAELFYKQIILKTCDMHSMEDGT